MRKGWQVTGVIMLLLSLITAWEAHNLALFDRLGPGPGFFPFWLALIGAVLCAVIVAQVSLATPDTRKEDPGVFPRGEALRMAIAIMVGSIVYSLVLDWLGFRLTTSVYVAALVMLLGERRWWAAVLFGLISGFGLFHLFNNWLDVLLPVGEFGI
jgi:putative tricarboxylic transport membrane protein